MTELSLSALDLVPIVDGGTSGGAFANSVRLARHVEDLGFRRFWLGEHHGVDGLASSRPALGVSLVAAHTTKLRVGAGGVLLANHSALAVAEEFSTLEALYPGRIDLAAGRGVGMHPDLVAALRNTEWAPSPDSFDRRLAELVSLLGCGDAPAPVTPRASSSPSLWMLASSEGGACNAARLGMPLAFAYHINGEKAVPAAAAYRSRFKSSLTSSPYLALSVFVIVGESDEHAEWLAAPYLAAFGLFDADGSLPRLPAPDEAMHRLHESRLQEHVSRRRRGCVIGCPEHVRRTLLDLVDRTSADELIITTIVHDIEERLRSFTRLRAAVS